MNVLQVFGRHGPLGNKADLIKYRDMLMVARDRVQKLKTAGNSTAEIIASTPLADLDPVWGHGMLSAELFVQMICSAL